MGKVVKRDTEAEVRKPRGAVLKVGVQVGEGAVEVSVGDMKASVALSAESSAHIIGYAIQSALRIVRPTDEKAMVEALTKLAAGKFGKKGGGAKDEGPDLLVQAYARATGKSVAEAAEKVNGLSRSDKQKLHHHPKVLRAKLDIMEEQGKMEELA